MAEKDSLGWPKGYVGPMNIPPSSSDTDQPPLFNEMIAGKGPADPQGLMPEQGSRKK